MHTISRVNALSFWLVGQNFTPTHLKKLVGWGKVLSRALMVKELTDDASFNEAYGDRFYMSVLDRF
jgi:hypothetical protein